MVVRSAVATNICPAFLFSCFGPLLVLRGNSRGIFSSGPAPNAWPVDRLPSWARRSSFPWNTNYWGNNIWLVWEFLFLISLQFEASAFETRWRGEHCSRFGRGRVRGVLPSRPPLWVSILFCKIAARTNPRPFHFVLRRRENIPRFCIPPAMQSRYRAFQHARTTRRHCLRALI